jgi:hypothetical protein
MSTTTQDFVRPRRRTSVMIDRDLAIVVLFSVLGLLASVFFMTHFPL